MSLVIIRNDPASAGWFDGFNGYPKASRDPVYLEFYKEGEMDAEDDCDD